MPLWTSIYAWRNSDDMWQTHKSFQYEQKRKLFYRGVKRRFWAINSIQISLKLYTKLLRNDATQKVKPRLSLPENHHQKTNFPIV